MCLYPIKLKATLAISTNNSSGQQDLRSMTVLLLEEVLKSAYIKTPSFINIDLCLDLCISDVYE